MFFFYSSKMNSVIIFKLESTISLSKETCQCFTSTLDVSLIHLTIFSAPPLTFHSDRQIGKHTTVHACLSLTWHVDSCLTLWHFYTLLHVFLNTPDKLQPALSASRRFMLIPVLWFVISSGVLCAYCAFWLAFWWNWWFEGDRASTVTTDRQ